METINENMPNKQKLRFNYVFFDSEDKRIRKDKKGYRYICSKDLEKVEGVLLVTYPLDYACSLVRFLFLLHNSTKINRLIKLPFKQKWFPFYFKNTFRDNKPICFIVSGRYASIEYLRFLKKAYPTAKIVKMHRDLFHLWKERNPQFDERAIDELFDLSITYDKNEADKYNMLNFDEFESKIEIKRDKKYPLHDVIFVGKAKDRLNSLIKVYDKLSLLGLKPFFYITGVEKKDRIYRDGIFYKKSNLSYYDMLYATVNSKYILEINQEGAIGYTSRFLEAVIYNKKIITNNASIKNSKFYNPDNVLILDENLNIDPSFFENRYDDVDYHYNGEFSPLNVIKLVDAFFNLEQENITNENNRNILR